MADLANYVRIYDAAPDDDMVGKREAALKDASGVLRKLTSPMDLVALSSAAAQSFTGAVTPDPLGSAVAAAIKGKAASFVREERELEVSVISSVAILDLLNGPETANFVTAKDIIASAVWSALSFQTAIADAKHEQLRDDLLQSAQSRVQSRAEAGRKRGIPKEVPEASEGDVAQMVKSLNVARASISTLEINAVIDREEIDMVWWAIGGRSPVLGTAYDKIEPSVRGVVRGIELGILSRRLPSRSMRSLALSGVPETPEITLSELLEAAKEWMAPLAATIPAQNIVTAHPMVFPLLSAIVNGEAAPGGVKKSGDQWSGRAVLETGLASLCQTPNPRL